MKRLHVSLAVKDLAKSREFYSAMFGSKPTMERDHYVQWVLDDPGINFVVEDANSQTGLTHLGMQPSNADELAEQYERVRATGEKVIDQGDTQCCFAKSTKNWVVDPDGIAWETFLTHERTEDFGTPFVADSEQALQGPQAAEQAIEEPAARCC